MYGWIHPVFGISNRIPPAAPRANRTVLAAKVELSRAQHLCRKSSAASKNLDAFIENANKNEVAVSALSADTVDSQKLGVFRRSDPLTCKNPPKNRVHLGRPSRRNSPDANRLQPRDRRRIDQDDQKHSLGPHGRLGQHGRLGGERSILLPAQVPSAPNPTFTTNRLANPPRFWA